MNEVVFAVRQPEAGTGWNGDGLRRRNTTEILL